MAPGLPYARNTKLLPTKGDYQQRGGMATGTDTRVFLTIGAVLAALGVAAGAMGAHALEGLLSAERLDTYHTAVRYHLIHALALTVVGVLQIPGPWLARAGWLFLAGIVLFSGSLYVLIATDITAFGAVTPFGGVALITGWLSLAAAGISWRRLPRTEG